MHSMITPEMEHETLEYRQGVVQNLQEAIQEYMEFSSTRELIRIIDLTING